MDNTKEYILQCEKAEEIQLLKPNPKEEDRNDVEYVSYFYLPEEERVEILKFDNDEDHPIIGGYHDDESGAIWLPTQDQLQDLLNYELSDLTYDFNEFNFDKKFGGLLSIDKFTSMEQLWLAFVMYEKYVKYWDGKKWESDFSKINNI